MAYNVKGQPTQLSLDTTETSTVIEGLKPYTSYCIRVQGYTKIGPSAWSNCTTVMTLQSGEVYFLKCDQFENTNHSKKKKNCNETQTNRKATGVCDKLRNPFVTLKGNFIEPNNGLFINL